MWDEDPRVALVSNWHLNESGSNTRYDSRGGNHLTASGSTIGSTTGLGGTDAMSLTRANQDHAGRASTPSLQTGDVPYTFICAIKRASTGGTHIIASKDGSTREWQLSIGGTNLVAANVFRPTTLTATSTFGATSTGTWYVTALVHNASADTLGVFVSDGTTHKYDEVATGGALQAAGTAQFRIGSSQLVPTAAFDGVIDEALWYRRVVSVGDLERIAELIITDTVNNWLWYADRIGGRVNVINGGILGRGVLGGKLIGG